MMNKILPQTVLEVVDGARETSQQGLSVLVVDAVFRVIKQLLIGAIWPLEKTRLCLLFATACQMVTQSHLLPCVGTLLRLGDV